MNSTDQQSETSQKKAICIIQLVIVYSVLTLTQSKYFVSYTIKLQCQLTQHKRCSERGQILSPNNFKKVLRNHIHIENIDQKINFYDSDETEIRLPFCRSFSTFQNVFGGLCTQVFCSWSWVRGDVKSFICVVKLKSHTTATQI